MRSTGAGKTYWLNEIAGTRLPSDVRVHTQGLSVKISEKHHFVMIDSEGSHNPAQVTDNLTLEQAMVRQLCVNLLTTKALFELATIHIIVINELSFA
jgi:hypothetical protein